MRNTLSIRRFASLPAALLFAALISAPVFAETAPVEPVIETALTKANANDRASGEQTAADVAEPKKKASRLRFRNGPVCMCADGLSENDILESQKRTSKKNEILQNNQGRQP